MISHYYHHLLWREFEFLGFSEVHFMDEKQGAVCTYAHEAAGK